MQRSTSCSTHPSPPPAAAAACPPSCSLCAAAAMAAATATIEADAYARLYPDQYFAKFIESGVRPDGRPLALARATSIALRAVSTADASALVKVGATAVLAGVKCEVAPAPADAPDEGRLVLQVRGAWAQRVRCGPHACHGSVRMSQLHAAGRCVRGAALLTVLCIAGLATRTLPAGGDAAAVLRRRAAGAPAGGGGRADGAAGRAAGGR